MPKEKKWSAKKWAKARKGTRGPKWIARECKECKERYQARKCIVDEEKNRGVFCSVGCAKQWMLRETFGWKPLDE